MFIRDVIRDREPYSLRASASGPRRGRVHGPKKNRRGLRP